VSQESVGCGACDTLRVRSAGFEWPAGASRCQCREVGVRPYLEDMIFKTLRIEKNEGFNLHCTNNSPIEIYNIGKNHKVFGYNVGKIEVFEERERK
jgi:hypothetical protein